MSFEDAYKLDSGLRESMDFTIVNPYFSTNASYQNGIPILLYLNGFDENEEPVEMFMSVGSDWITADGGKTITHPTKTRVNKNSVYGHWLQHAIEIPELRELLYSRGAPTNAEVWNNLIIHLELRELKFGRNVEPQERLMPVSFIGEYVDTPNPTPPLTPAPASTTVTPSAADIVAQARAAAASSNGGSPLYNQMVDLAKSSPDFPTFLTTALSNSDVLADDELAQQVADEGGIWAASH